MITIGRCLPATVSYHCYGCQRVVEGHDTRWLMDEDERAYPFCCGCVNQPWPLSEIPGPDDSRVFQLWDDGAMVITWDSH